MSVLFILFGGLIADEIRGAFEKVGVFGGGWCCVTMRYENYEAMKDMGNWVSVRKTKGIALWNELWSWRLS